MATAAAASDTSNAAASDTSDAAHAPVALNSMLQHRWQGAYRTCVKQLALTALPARQRLG